MKKRVAIVGGGVSGLAAAHRLLELDPRTEVSLYEASGRLGGIIATEKRDGFLLEKGPDSFLSEKKAALDLCGRLGIESRLIGTREAHRRSFILREHKLIPVPKGFYLIAPTDTAAFLKSPLFSWPGKLRMLQEPFIRPKKDGADETIANFVRRRFGKENLARAGQPMVAGIYTGDPEELSLRATLPRLKLLEETYGSVTRGLRASKAERSASGPRYSLFLSFDEGMQVLTDALAAKLFGANVQLNAPVKSVRREGEEWKLVLENGETSADAVILALPATLSANLLRGMNAGLAGILSSIRYESVATLNVAFPADSVRHPLDGFGFVVPEDQPFSTIACTFSSRKFDGRAPENTVLLRAFLGGAFRRDVLEKDDDTLIDEAVRELSRVLGIQGKPLFTRLERHPRSMVQYRLGHPAAVEKIRAEAERFPGLSLIGPATGGAGIPDCVEQAETEAGRIDSHLNKRNP